MMRWIITIYILGITFQSRLADTANGTVAKPEDIKPITLEEKQFLKAVEAEFGINQKGAIIEVEEPQDEDLEEADKTALKPLPSVIAIEIVNDTNSEKKGKRTIDANLGYGYKTNTGYAYTYFGKPKEEKGKFMIYPYSQEDIPIPPKHQNYFQSAKATDVDIQPSKAFELVPVNEERNYGSKQSVSGHKSHYEQAAGIETPPPPQNYHQNIPSTLYTTYEGGQLSKLSGQFPRVMPNYFVNSNQLLDHPQYQNVGITPEHLRPHAPAIEQGIVPVLVLRIPSSHLQNPTAELYPNLPENYPLSNYLNGVNLQQLVAQYLHKLGYTAQQGPAQQVYMSAPQMAHYQQPEHESHTQHPSIATPIEQPQPQYEYTNYEGVQPTAEAGMPTYSSTAEDVAMPHSYAVHQQQEPEKSYRYLPPTAYMLQSPSPHIQYIQQTVPQEPQYYQQQEYEAQNQYQIPQGYEQYYQEQSAHQSEPTSQQQYEPSHYITQAGYQGTSSSEESELPVSENYPSKDHTRVIISKEHKSKQSMKVPTQTVAYVTPAPNTKIPHKYHVMAPQAAFSLQQQHYMYQSPREYVTEQQQFVPSNYYLPTKSQSQNISPHYMHSKRFAGKMPAKGFRKHPEKSKSS